MHLSIYLSREAEDEYAGVKKKRRRRRRRKMLEDNRKRLTSVRGYRTLRHIDITVKKEN